MWSEVLSAPSQGSYTIYMKIVGDDNKELSCISFGFSIGFVASSWTRPSLGTRGSQPMDDSDEDETDDSDEDETDETNYLLMVYVIIQNCLMLTLCIYAIHNNRVIHTVGRLGWTIFSSTKMELMQIDLVPLLQRNIYVSYKIFYSRRIARALT
jgi:hypothetical protein